MHGECRMCGSGGALYPHRVSGGSRRVQWSERLGRDMVDIGDIVNLCRICYNSNPAHLIPVGPIPNWERPVARNPQPPKSTEEESLAFARRRAAWRLENGLEVSEKLSRLIERLERKLGK